MRALTALVAAAGLAVAGCGGGSAATDAGGPRASDIAPAEGVVSRSYGGTLELQVSGAVEAAWSGVTPISVLTAVGEGRPRQAWQLTVGLLEAVDGGAGWTVRPAFDLIGYAGDGRYVVEPERPGGADPVAAADGGKEAALSSALHSTALLVAGRQGTEPSMYTELSQPCALEVSDRGLAGSIDCPAMHGPGGPMAVRWSWAADADQLLHEQVVGAQADDEAGPPAEDEAGSDAGTKAAPPGGSDAPAPGPASQPGAPGADEPQASMPLEVVLDAACYEPGSAALVTITSEPDAALGMAVAFSDARPYGLYQLGRTDPQGTFRWAFTIPPEAPTGEGHVLVSAGSADGERAASGATPFQVDDSC